MSRRVVVVGGGLAGARTCEELRAQGFDGEVVLVGAEEHRPYDRPPLSKAVLLDDAVPDVTLPTSWEDLSVELRLGVTATRLRAGRLSTTDGDIGYDDCVLALGAEPVRLSGMDGARTLRTVDDAVGLRAALRPGARVVVVGAGWIGAEVATAAARRGCATTVVEAGPAPLATAVGAQVGARTVPWYAAAGVDLRLGDPLVRTERGAVVLRDAGRLEADVVVAAVGVRPRLGWLEDSGLELTDGVVTDAAGRTPVHGVWAVGDCARRWSPRAGRLVRTEHWDDALHAPSALVTALLGGTAAYDPVPYVWSEQFGRMLQWVGWRRSAGPGDEPSVWRGDPKGDAGWGAAWLDERGRLTGFVGVDRPRDVQQARKAIAAGAMPDPDRLANPAVVVRDA